tara:strand:+ start:458 stop:634 length:177 start_codon:yes stop_codon:yes gene_type:complete
MFYLKGEKMNITQKIKRRRMIRKWKKILTPDEVIAPFVGGLVFLFVIVVFTFKLHGVI